MIKLIYFREISRTQGVSTTDLVGRMLLMTRNHFQKGDSEYEVGKDGKWIDLMEFIVFLVALYQYAFLLRIFIFNYIM